MTLSYSVTVQPQPGFASTSRGFSPMFFSTKECLISVPLSTSPASKVVSRISTLVGGPVGAAGAAGAIIGIGVVTAFTAGAGGVGIGAATGGGGAGGAGAASGAG